MECYKIDKLSFAYPSGRTILDNISLDIKQGQFVTLCGQSGCGKTTLLRHLKPMLSPHGNKEGEIFFNGRSIEDLEQREEASLIGFVLQSPDNQIVTDKVWHELAFGLESLGEKNDVIRLRVAEMASFFGIESWFYKEVSELSGGQKQLLNLASIMAMQPSVLILDEPTSQLDPIASSEFIATVAKINRELGTTIIMTEHRLDEVIPISDRVIVMDSGKIIADGSPKEIGRFLSDKGHDMFLAMPIPMRIFASVENSLECPITIRDGRNWISSIAEGRKLRECPKGFETAKDGQAVIELKDVWFKYEKDGADIVKGVNITVKKGEFLSILGGNGTGKTTTLSLMANLNKPYRGNIKIKGENISDIDEAELFNGILGVLPQNPQSLFVKKTVELELLDMLSDLNMTEEEKHEQLDYVVSLCRLNALLNQHPYDLSGGEQQRTALAKILLMQPEILLLDEPTKGLDAEFKEELGQIIKNLRDSGATVIMVSHDIEFCAKYSHRCALFFDGNIVTSGEPKEFFSGNSFYTTGANRMSRHILDKAVTVSDVIYSLNGTLREKKTEVPPKPEAKKIISKPVAKKNTKEQTEKNDRRLSKRTIAAAVMILLLIPLTIFAGVYYFGDRKYYFISLLIILETMVPFVMIFEGRKPKARELIIISVLCAIAVAGRGAFFMIPQFKPVVAIVIISGVAFGGETGFLVGAVTGFVSNMFFGQGPWTPWQMFSFGIIGFIAGVLFKKGLLRRSVVPLSLFGFFATFIIYGGIMNPASVLTFQGKPTAEMFLLSYLRAIPFDLIHSGATFFFLAVISQPMLEKLDRIKIKYGLIE